VHMPEMDGLEVLQKIRKIRPAQKVVLMTSDRDDELFGKAVGRELPVQGFINKPFTVDVFETCVRTVLVVKGKFTHRKEGYH